MPSPEATTHQFTINALLYGPIKPCQELNRQRQRVLKGHSQGKDFFTEITLQDHSQSGTMKVEYSVTAQSPCSAERVGAVYLSQLCDLLSVATRCGVRFYMPDDDARDERIQQSRRSTTVDRILTVPEWEWVTGNLVFFRRKHPRFLAAASWYRKGLLGKDALDDFCCFWRVIERLAASYSDKSKIPESDRGKAKFQIDQLLTDLFPSGSPPVLSDEKQRNLCHKLRNDLSHGNVPITVELIDQVTSYVQPLEDAAYAVLDAIRQNKLIDSSE
jgi:hypothetical protein